MARLETEGTIRAGMGSWTYGPWRGVFYPKGLKQADELGYATSHVTSIEINATHYRLQSPKSFKRWADTAPDDFKYAVKGPRLVTQQKVLAETGMFIERFLGSGLSELGDKLGPVLWQFAPFKKFNEDDFARFLDHLSDSLDGQTLNHVVEVRHASFHNPAFIRLSAASRPSMSTASIIPRSPTSRAKSCMCACSAVTRRSRPVMPPTTSTPGRSAQRPGRKAPRPATCPW